MRNLPLLMENLSAQKEQTSTWIDKLTWAELDFIHLKLEPFRAVPGLQTGSQTFSGIQRLTDIQKSLEKI